MTPQPHPSELDLAAMERAFELAKEAAARDEVPVGAVVYEADTLALTVVGEASNRVEELKDPTAHAEMLAIRAALANSAGKRLPNCAIAVTLEPCPMCAGAIVHARLQRVVYGAPDPKGGACRSLYELCDDSRLNHRAQIIDRVMAEKSSEMLRAFFKAKRS